jgi:regulator of protease activity HflC (stomatin/prohibitin superfamily)
MLARFDYECNKRPAAEIPDDGFSLLNRRADRTLRSGQGGGGGSLRGRGARGRGAISSRIHVPGCRSHAVRPTIDEDIMSLISIVLLAAILYCLGSIRILRQYERGVVFFLGKFEGVRGPGLTLIFVPIQQMVRVSLRTVTMQIPSQKIITKDNVSIDIAAVAYYHITDPERSVIAIENVYNAINQISQTTVRNVVGRFSLDQLLSDTSSINDQIKNVIDQHTEPWGTQVTAVEIKDITLPDNMQRAMAKEAEAERERRAKIVAAEGEYQAAVKLGEAADIITAHPVALQLRTLQTMAEISVEKNSTIIFPAQFMTTVQEAIALLSKGSAAK